MSRIAGFEIDAGKFVGSFASSDEIIFRQALVEDLLLELCGFVSLALKRIGHGRGAQGLLLGIGRRKAERLREVFAGFGVVSFEVESNAGVEMSFVESWIRFKGFFVQGQGFVLLAFTAELLTLFNQAS